MKKTYLLLTIVIFIILISSSVCALSKSSIEDDNYEIQCNKEVYYWIGGEHSVYCNITSKVLEHKETTIGSFLELEKDVQYKEIYLLNEKGERQQSIIFSDVLNDKAGKSKSKGYEKSFTTTLPAKQTLSYEIVFNSNSIPKDEFWVTLKNSLTTLELDPAITGCAEIGDTLYCNDTTFTGNSIDTNLNIRIFNATLDGTIGGLINLTSTAGWIQINQSTIDGVGATNLNGMVLLKADKDILINGSNIEAWGMIISTTNGKTGWCNLSANGDITIYGSTLGCSGSIGICSDCNPGNTGGSGYFYIYANSTTINQSAITSYGGVTGNCYTCTHVGGDGNFNAFINNDFNICGSSSISSYGAGGGSFGGHQDDKAYGGNSYVNINAKKLKINGYNTSVINLAFYGGSSGTANGISYTNFNVNDELRLDDNISVNVLHSSTAANFSKINFTGSNNLKLLFSGVSIPNNELFVFCPNKPANQNLRVVWEQYAGKTQEINFSYCSYENISRAIYLDANAPTYANWQNNASTATYRYGSVNFSINLEDNTALNYYYFAHNQSGTLTNVSNGYLSGTSTFLNYTLAITLRKNNYICGQYWANDTANNINQTNLSCFTVQNAPPILKTDLMFKNSTIGHNFTVNATFTDWDNFSDISNITIGVSSGTCYNGMNITLGDDFTAVFNCTGTALSSTTIQINVTDFSGIIKESSQLTTAYPNTAPTMTGTQLNKTSGVLDTDDLNCSATGASDLDLDTTTYHYEWYNNSAAKGIDNVKLTSQNLTGLGTWYCEAWVADGYENSSKYSSGSISVNSSQVSPSIITANATTALTGINSTATNPTNNNSWLNMSVQFADANADAWTAYFCDTSTWLNCQANASGAILCKSENNLTIKTLTCMYDVSGYAGANPKTFYAFVLDNTSKQSSPISATFEINYPEGIPSLVYPPINSYFNANYTFINWTASVSGLDASSDAINYSLYINESSGFVLIYNGTNKYFNYSIPLEYITYNWRVYTHDEHNYGYHNVTLGNFTSDYTKPNLTVTSPTATTYNSITVSLTINAKDFAIDVCNYTMYLKDTGGYYSSGNANCAGATSLSTPYYSGGYKLDVFAYDKTGNINSTEINFTTEALVTSPPSGGGSTVPSIQCAQDSECKKFGNNSICVQNFCIYKEYEDVCIRDNFCDVSRGETPINCNDVLLDNQTILSGDCHWFSTDVIKMGLSSNFFLWFVLIMIILLTIYYSQLKEDSFTQKIYKKYYPRGRRK